MADRQKLQNERADHQTATGVVDDATAIARDLHAEPHEEELTRLPGAWIVDKMPYVPIAFLGLAFYRAWIELVFVGAFIPFPAESNLTHDVFDIVMVVVLFACAAISRKIEPLYRKHWAYWACGILMCTGSAMAFATLFSPASAPLLSVPASVLGGAGTALIILLWSELYSCLPPYKVGLYYCAAIVVAALLLYLCRGFASPWNAVMSFLLPLISLACCALGFMSIPPTERPHAQTARFSFPWKPTLLMAIYAFAYGLRETSQYATTFGPHSAPGALVIAAVL
ncbi:MAG: helix-turn-helix transcriptional regulator, partial [Eggerthellaceae bacterium]|nr:helix-turn-helix transcriptional regulator [Eggerthellaceae bacterium]